MTLARIMELALRQLDEDLADISEFDALFTRYANEGYSIAQRKWYHPREMFELVTDENGTAILEGMNIVHVLLVRRGNRGEWYSISPDGKEMHTMVRNGSVSAVCEVELPQLERPTDEPKLPARAHAALADYICYRHLLNGNTAKQSRAQMYLMQFERAMREMGRMGEGSITHMRGLYAATDIRNTRW
jgi:hypothetical protein